MIFEDEIPFRAAKAKWTTEEEIELKTLYDQHKEHEGNGNNFSYHY